MILTTSGWVIYRFRQTKSLTLAQFFEKRYSRNFRIFAGIIAFVTPIDGDLSSTETVEVVVRNFGTVTQSNIEVSFTLDGGTPVTEVVAGPIAPASKCVNWTPSRSS